MNLIGYCEEDKPFTRMVVFEYAPNGTLFEHLHSKHLTSAPIFFVYKFFSMLKLGKAQYQFHDNAKYIGLHSGKNTFI